MKARDPYSRIFADPESEVTMVKKIFREYININIQYQIRLLQFPSVCSRLTFYWKQLRSCCMAGKLF
jgi:hypothetical protein